MLRAVKQPSPQPDFHLYSTAHNARFTIIRPIISVKSGRWNWKMHHNRFKDRQETGYGLLDSQGVKTPLWYTFRRIYEVAKGQQERREHAEFTTDFSERHCGGSGCGLGRPANSGGSRELGGGREFAGGIAAGRPIHLWNTLLPAAQPASERAEGDVEDDRPALSFQHYPGLSHVGLLPPGAGQVRFR